MSTSGRTGSGPAGKAWPWLEATDFGQLGADEHVNLATMTAVVNQAATLPAGTPILVPPGDFPLADRVSIPDKCGLFVPGAPVTIDTVGSLAELPIRTWFHPGPSFNPAKRVFGFGKHCFLSGAGIDASNLADGAVELNGDDFWSWCASLFGGLSWTLLDNANAARVTLQTCDVNNVRNNTGAIFATGNDWKVADCRKKGGTLHAYSGGGDWSDNHLTGGVPNVDIGAPCRIEGGQIDSTKDATGPLILDDRGGHNAGVAIIQGVKFLQNTAATNVDIVQRHAADPAPLTIGEGCHVDAQAGAGFTSIINYLGGSGGLADVVKPDMQAAFNAFSTAAPTLFKGGLPAQYGPIMYRGAPYPGARTPVFGPDVNRYGIASPNWLKPASWSVEAFSRAEASMINTVVSPGSGKPRAGAIPLPAGMVVSALHFVSGSTAAAVPLNQWFAISDAARNVLAFTFDDLTTPWANSTEKVLPLCRLTPASVSTAAGSNVITFGAGDITAVDVTRQISIAGAGAAGALLGTSAAPVTITGLVDATHATISVNAGTAVGPIAVFMQTPITISSSGLYYGYAMVNGTTAPTFMGTTAVAAIQNLLPVLSGPTGDAGMTGVPALPFAFAAIGGSVNLVYFGVS